MKKYVLGIDIGTSSVKAICKSIESEANVAIEPYESYTVFGWWTAFKKVLLNFDLKNVIALGLTGQIGTYIINKEDVIHWSDSYGKEQLDEIMDKFNKEQFLKEIQMNHPRLISFPIPRLMYISRKYNFLESIMMPKEYIVQKLTGNCISDNCSWRGLYNFKEKKYSNLFMDYIGIKEEILPKIVNMEEKGGFVTRSASVETGLTEGVPVFVGCNDFYSALIGMGVTKENQIFDLTGTSEHAGVIVKGINSENALVCSPYLDKFVHYGVTASSGASLNFNKINFGEKDIDIHSCITKNPPIFLPYLNGERAPVWDCNASGVFFGLTDKTDKEQLSYSVFEGVVFSIFSILKTISSFKPGTVTVGGGAANNEVLNKLKAEIFSSDILLLEQNQSSAFGAYMISAVGIGIYTSLDEAVKINCIKKKIIKHDGQFSNLFMQRYEIYESMYPLLKDTFGKFRGIK